MLQLCHHRTPKSHSNSPEPAHFHRLRLHNTATDSFIIKSFQEEKEEPTICHVLFHTVLQYTQSTIQSSVSDPYSSNSDPDPAKNQDPDPARP